MAIRASIGIDTDLYGDKLYTFYLDTGDTTSDLPSSTESKGFRLAKTGDTAIGADGTVYMYFETAGWTEV